MDSENKALIKNTYTLSENSNFNLEDITIKEALHDFLSHYQSSESRRAYNSDISRFFLLNNFTYLYELRPYHRIQILVNEYINNYKKISEHHSDRIINGRTVNRVAYSLSAFFSYLVHTYNFPKNPLGLYKALESDKHSNTTSFTKSELKYILNYVKNQYLDKPNQETCRNYILVMILSVLALRRNEIVKLRWSDIKTDSSDEFYISVFQKGRSLKELPLPSVIINALNDYKSMLKKTSDYIFIPVMNNHTKDFSKPIDSNTLYRIIKKLIRQVIPDKSDASPHSFRKTFIELSLNEKEDFINICNATGHSNIGMIRYYDTRDKIKNNSVNIISSIL